MKGEIKMFKIAPKVYSSMFSLPTEIADKGLKFATGEQLKVIIAIFRNPEITVEEIAKILKISKSAVKMRLKRAREILKIELEDYNYEEK